MLKTKRSYECLEENFDASPSCSPFSMPQPSDSTSPKRKRFRAHAIEPKRVIPASQSRFANPPPYKGKIRICALPSRRSGPNVILYMVGELLKQYVARTVEKNASCPPKKAKDLLFSYEDLEDVLRRALAEQEEQMRQEYDSLLETHQQEQFQAFAKFNDDFITKKTCDQRYASCTLPLLCSSLNN